MWEDIIKLKREEFADELVEEIREKLGSLIYDLSRMQITKDEAKRLTEKHEDYIDAEETVLYAIQQYVRDELEPSE